MSVMNIGGSNGVASDKTMFNNDADAVLVTVVINAILLDPASV